MKSAAILALTLASANAFVPSGSAKQSTKLGITLDESSSMLEKIKLIVAMEDTPDVDPVFDKIVKTAFPNAISNQDLESGVVEVLSKKGFTGKNTLLATSLCCDELARKLEGTFILCFSERKKKQELRCEKNCRYYGSDKIEISILSL